MIAADAAGDGLHGGADLLHAALGEPGADARGGGGDAALLLRVGAAAGRARIGSSRRGPGSAILERYGMTETGMNASNPLRGRAAGRHGGAGAAGVALRVCGRGGRELPAGETGVLEVRGPNVFAGYWRLPEKTAEEMRPDGFFVTGDMARIEADGYVTSSGGRRI